MIGMPSRIAVTLLFALTSCGDPPPTENVPRMAVETPPGPEIEAAPTVLLTCLPEDLARALNGAESWELLALDPFSFDRKDPGKGFHGWDVLASAHTMDTALKDELTAALNAAMECRQGRMAGCYQPRHGLRVQTDAGQIDVEICFQCVTLKVYREGEEKSFRRANVQSEARPAVDAVFTALGLEISR